MKNSEKIFKKFEKNPKPSDFIGEKYFSRKKSDCSFPKTGMDHSRKLEKNREKCFSRKKSGVLDFNRENERNLRV